MTHLYDASLHKSERSSKHSLFSEIKLSVSKIVEIEQLYEAINRNNFLKIARVVRLL